MVDASPSASKSAVRTAVWLGLFVVLAFGLRAYFGADVGFDAETERNLFTGNDPYYHWRTVSHVVDTGSSLTYDTAFNYPEGNQNPNPPFWTWTTAPVAILMDAMGVADPVGTALNVMVAFWGALIVLPTYVIGRDLWGRSAGLWAAFFIAFSAPHIQRSVWGYADHDAISMFFIALAFMFLVKALKAMRSERFVADWRKTGTIVAGKMAAIKANRNALVYAALAGIAITACAITWKGYPYVMAILAVAAGAQLAVDHLRRRDGLATLLVFATVTAVATLLPYLLVYQHATNYIAHTVSPSLYVLLGILVAGFLLVPTRDLPSILVFPGVAVAAVLALAALLLLFPATGADLFSGLGYFAQSKLYSTIAEAQRPTLGEVAANFAFFTFLIGFWGFAHVVRKGFKGDAASLLVASWSAVALFMTFAAARFIVNAAPVFVLLVAYAMVQLLGRLGLADVKKRFAAGHGQNLMGRSVRSLSGKSVAGVLLVGAFLVLPNVWTAVDAGMPTDYEVKNGLLQGGQANKFGAFGVSFELKDNGWNQAMAALAAQDTGMALEDKPAFIAWWDYGHWALGMGAHPTVADPFQSHYELSGRFLASDSEAEAISWLSIHLLVGDVRMNGGFSAPVRALLQSDAPALLDTTFSYGHYDSSYSAFKTAVADPAAFYGKLQDATGKRIGYLGVDRRMFPYDDPNTQGVEASSIFYAPVFLSNKNPDEYMRTQVTSGSTTLTIARYGIDADGRSFALETPTYTDQLGNRWVEVAGYAYREGQTPLQGFSAESGIPLFGGESMTVTAKFYETLFGRAFGGLSAQSPAGDGLAHFRVLHQSTQPSNQPGLDIRDVVLLAYYEGVQVSGTVRDETGSPLAGLQVAFADGTGARHGTATTAADGSYRVLAPFSVDGDLELQVVSGGATIYSDNRSALQFSRAQAMDGAQVGGIDITLGRSNLSGVAYRDLNGNGAFDGNDTAVAGATVSAGGVSTTSGPDGAYSLNALAPGQVTVQATAAGYQNATQQVTLRAGSMQSANLAMVAKSSSVTVTMLNTNGTAMPSVPIRVEGTSVTTLTTNTQGVATTSLVPGSYNLQVDTTVNGQAVKASGTLVVPFGGEPVAFTLNRQA